MSSVCRSHVIRISLYVLVCHLYGACMYSHIIRLSLVGTQISFVCHWHVEVCYSSLVYTYMSLVCHSYVTRMYSYVIRMLLVVCHSWVLLCNLSLRIKYKVLIKIPRTPHKMLLVISYLFKRRKLQLFARARCINW